uniref:Kazal-like domain-containing protein n=1 Tax=Erpetoichthys calabaricus TaxID=27687 RepID=A0A8C4RQB7_ERPCA
MKTLCLIIHQEESSIAHPIFSQDFCQKYKTPNDCPLNDDPVCGADGEKYKNECRFCLEYRDRNVVPVLAKCRG